MTVDLLGVVAARLDFRLLAELNRSPFASNAELGRRFGVSGEAVRQRLDRLEEEGVLCGFSAIPAAHVFGRQACDLIFAVPIDLDLLLRQPDVVYAVNSIDGRCAIKGYVHDVAAFERRVTAAVGDAPWQTIHGPRAGPPDPMGTLDLRVLRALVEAPRATFRQLQGATGLSYRTVRARRQRLVASGAIAVQPILRRSRNGDLYHNLHLQGPACTDEAALHRLLHDHFVLERWQSPPSVYLFCHEESLDAHVLMIETLRRTPGIDQVDVVLTNEYRLAADRVLGWIDARLEAWDDRRV